MVLSTCGGDRESIGNVFQKLWSSVKRLGENLIFIISQPRAGSTLLQRILGGHPKFHTLSEPWIMLNPIYALRSAGTYADYSFSHAHEALKSMLEALPNGEEDYIESVRRSAGYLYDQAIKSSGKQFFIDKTPRYYLIIPELLRVFPKARYIILLRNPLAVLSSIIHSWIGNDWISLYKHRLDLALAPSLLSDAIDKFGSDIFTVHYETLVENPSATVGKICDWIGVDFIPEIVNYETSQLPKWSFGDQTKIYEFSSPSTDSREKWIESLNDAQIWRLTRDYLRLLGDELTDAMGYDHARLSQILADHRPMPSVTIPLSWLLSRKVFRISSLMRKIVR